MFPLIELSGSAYERGTRHGVVAKALVQRSIATYSRLFAYCGSGTQNWRINAIDEEDRPKNRAV
jgi:hypothetical protein